MHWRNLYLLLLLAGTPGLEAAPSEGLKPSLSTTLGTEYEDNLSLENEPRSGGSDSAWLLGVDAGLAARIDQRWRLNADYSFSGNRHSELREYDLHTHMASFAASFDQGASTYGATLFYIDARLDGDAYLQIDQGMLSAGHFFSPSWYSYHSLSLGTKDYAQSENIPQEDAGQGDRATRFTHLQSDLYHFLRGTQRYWMAGLRWRDERADDPLTEYQGWQLRLRWVQQLRGGEQPLAWRMEGQWETRHYGDPTRDEDRLGLSSALEWRYTTQLHFGLQFNWDDYRSPAPAFDARQSYLAALATYHWY